MKVFQFRELSEAIAHAAAGEQAVHLHQVVFASSPKCFREAVARGEKIAHLFDQNVERLKTTAKRLGVRVIIVGKEGTDRQHIDLCGQPLLKALLEAVA